MILEKQQLSIFVLNIKSEFHGSLVNLKMPLVLEKQDAVFFLSGRKQYQILLH